MRRVRQVLTTNTERALALKIGQTIKPYGTLSAIHSRGGECDYFFTDKYGGINLMPGDLLEYELNLNKKDTPQK